MLRERTTVPAAFAVFTISRISPSSFESFKFGAARQRFFR